MVREAAGLIRDRAIESVRERGRFLLVLSGGSTPRPLYETLAREPFAAGLPWDRTHLFWGDERCVPPNDPNSNYRMAEETLISRVSVPPENVHRILGESASPEEAARGYERDLRRVFPEESFPRFDCILLGLGPDGHTASLFPGDAALEERTRWAMAVEAPESSPIRRRVTLSLPAINHGRLVLFLVSGSRKKTLADSILSGPEESRRGYPAARVSPDGRLVWFLCGDL
jgi:6-phosphogluconolactonase